MTLRVATWNVNSLNVRLPRLLDWLAANAPDIVGLQETKLEDGKFPVMELAAAGYALQFCGQRTYNGVALLSRTTGTEVVAALPDHDDVQKRVLAATIDGVRVVCLYVPNGQAVGSEKYRYKLDWLARINQWLAAELAANDRLVVVGDFNIAPDERDVYDPKAWEGQVLFSAPERQAFQDLLALGLKDSFRLFEQAPASFTWWDYRVNAFKRKMGLRIDHILLSGRLAGACRSSSIDIEPRKNERPSDHAPAIADFATT